MALALKARPNEGFIYSGTLASVPLGGGAPREMMENVEFADWSPDGSNLAIVHEVGGRKRLEFPPGKVLYDAEDGSVISGSRRRPTWWPFSIIPSIAMMAAR